ncbi:MAG TPA: hypothetical protein VFO16_09475 [Pseudonocardiaceae bacterium]|nr:hypothetical protein [Pseudonocardiaceae bacterium]
MNTPATPDHDPWRDTDGTPIPVGAVVEQTTVDIELGALRFRLGKHGQRGWSETARSGTTRCSWIPPGPPTRVVPRGAEQPRGTCSRRPGDDLSVLGDGPDGGGTSGNRRTVTAGNRSAIE